MPTTRIVRRIRFLRSAQGVHSRLVFRVKLLMLTTLILCGVTVYEVAQGASIGITLLSAIVGAVVGYLILRRENPVRLNETTALIEAKKMTVLGWIFIGLFALLKIVLVVALTHVLPSGAEAYLFAAFCGFLLGRLVAMLLEIDLLSRGRV